MHLIHDDVGHAEEVCIAAHTAQQDACRAEEQVRVCCHGSIQPHMVAYVGAWPARSWHATLVCHSLCHADRSYAPRLCTNDIAGYSCVAVYAVLEDVLRYLQGISWT